VDQLENLSKLIENRNEIDEQISSIIGYSGTTISVIDELWSPQIRPNSANAYLILAEDQKNRLKLQKIMKVYCQPTDGFLPVF
jgi:hypothetical protein